MTCYFSALMRGTSWDKRSQLGSMLFMLNGFRQGPLHGKYVIIETKLKREWCVAQLRADRERPVEIFEDSPFGSVDIARRAIELLLSNEKFKEAPNLVLTTFSTYEVHGGSRSAFRTMEEELRFVFDLEPDAASSG